MINIHKVHLLLASTALSGSLFATGAISGPTGENVVAGSATISRPSTARTEINQTSRRAIIEWDQFNINANGTVEFRQPDRASVTLNRVVGQNPSNIQGNLIANGTVLLVNPDGILFGPNSRIDTGGLVATTSDITNDNFLNDRFIFDQPGNPSASIINQGNITIRETGVAAFVAPGVRNEGVITARLGQIGLASANKFTLDLYGDNLINLEIDDEIANEVVDIATGQNLTKLVNNQGTISADGGQVALKAVTARKVVDRVINNDGILEANSVGLQNGKIVLGAATAETKTPQAPAQNVRVAGKIRASGRRSGETGGTVHITGENIAVPRARIDVTGDSGGGNVRLGGDFQGGIPSQTDVKRFNAVLAGFDIPTATNLFVDNDTVIDASAANSGDGGQVIAWSENTTDFRGTINATGGELSGNGGFAEVSGRKSLLFSEITADLTASNGQNGSILFDPEFLTVGEAQATATENILNQGINASLEASRLLTIDANILKTEGDSATLALLGGDGVTINPGVVIGSSSGPLNLFVDANSDFNTPESEIASLTLELFPLLFSLNLQDDIAEFARNNPFDSFDKNEVIGFANSVVDIIDQSIPESQTISFQDFISQGGDTVVFPVFQKERLENSVFINQGTLALNGGALTVFDNTIDVTITRDPTPTFSILEVPTFVTVNPDDPNDTMFVPPGTPIEFQPVFSQSQIDVDVSLQSRTAQNSSNPVGIPGAFVIDLTPPNNEPISQEFQLSPFSELVSFASRGSQSADTVLGFINSGSNFFVANGTGLIPVTQEEGIAIAQQAGLDVLDQQFDLGPDIPIPDNALTLDMIQNGRPTDTLFEELRAAFENGTDPAARFDQNELVTAKLSFDGGIALEFGLNTSIPLGCNNSGICVDAASTSLGGSINFQPRQGNIGVGLTASVSAITASAGQQRVNIGTLGGGAEVGLENGKLKGRIKTPGFISLENDL